MCGRLFTERPKHCLDKAPDAVRGVCRRCGKVSQNKDIPLALKCL